jgi:CRISPR-associated endonuclease/helicase Cas3
VNDPLPRVLAKSAQAGRPAESLTSHLAATMQAAAWLRDRIGRVTVLEREFGDSFWSAVLLAALAHDAGKVATGFQRLLTDSVRWGQRHEVVSLGFLPSLVPDKSLRRWVASAVVTHHRPLQDSDDSIETLYRRLDLEELRSSLGPVDAGHARTLVEWLAATAIAAHLPAGAPTSEVDIVAAARELLHDVLDEWELPVDDQDRGLAAVLLQGAVTMSDHLSSARRSLDRRQLIDAGIEQRLRRRLRRLHPHQERAGQIQGHLLLRAPTGSGKTEAGLLWTATQVDAIAASSGGTPRVFQVLPYLASINAMATRLGDVIGAAELVGVSHSRAGSYHLATAIAAQDGGGDGPPVSAAAKAASRAAATRLFQETVRVGTPYQLLRGALAGAAHSGIIVDLANSVYVLDELHAYDPTRLGYILAMMRLWERLGGRVAVLSATLPEALAEQVRSTLHGPVKTIDAGTAGLAPRHRLRTRDRHLTDPASLTEIGARIAGDQAVLAVANNIRDAQLLLDALGPAARDRHGPEGAVLLHSRFKRRDRSRIERRIHDRYQAGGQRAPGLVVATQVVEVSLDVDFDVLFTSAAPLEALLQRFGRVNRLGGRPPADVVVHRAAYRNRRGGRDEEFADGVYPRAPVELGWQILCQHADEPVDEVAAVNWLDDVYRSPWGEEWQCELERARGVFERDFLTFVYPYAGREHLADRFDELFEGTEAILREDEQEYAKALASTVDEDGRARPAAGRLLGEELLVPLPVWAAPLTTYDRRLRVRIVDGDYDPDRGLKSVRGPGSPQYQLGEVL